MILQLRFTLYQIHRLCLQPVNTEGLVPKRRAKYKDAAKSKRKVIISYRRRWKQLQLTAAVYP